MANGEQYVRITPLMLTHGSFARSWAILMLELDLRQYHLELVQQTNQYGYHTFTVMELRHLLQIVTITCHGIMGGSLVAATLVICQYLALMVSVVALYDIMLR